MPQTGPGGAKRQRARARRSPKRQRAAARGRTTAAAAARSPRDRPRSPAPTAARRPRAPPDGAALPLRQLDGFIVHAPGDRSDMMQLDNLQAARPRAVATGFVLPADGGGAGPGAPCLPARPPPGRAAARGARTLPPLAHA